MAYEAHEWETGEVISAEKLNNLEGNRILIVHSNDSGLGYDELDITPREAIKAISNNMYIIYQYMSNNNQRTTFLPLDSMTLEVGEDAYNQYEIYFTGDGNPHFTSGNLDAPYSEPDV